MDLVGCAFAKMGGLGKPTPQVCSVASGGEGDPRSTCPRVGGLGQKTSKRTLPKRWFRFPPQAFRLAKSGGFVISGELGRCSRK
jgi:hypothetical protein